MSKREEIFGRIGKMGGKLFVSAASLRQELEALSIGKLEALARRLDLVRRSDFEAVEAMAMEARRKQEELQRRVDSLAAQISGQSTGKKLPSKRGAKPAQAKRATESRSKRAKN
jgi:BMFP domain-containing protein YqiC